MDSGLKKRLLGAVVLIALAVIFVPMLLPSHSGTGAQSVSLKVPPEPSGAMQTRILKLGPDGASAGSSVVATTNDPDHVAKLNLEDHTPPAVSPAAPAPSIEATTAPVASTPTVAAASTPAVVAATGSPAKVTALPSSASVPKPSAQTAPVVATAKPAPSAAASAAPLSGGAGAAAGTLYTVNLGIYADHASAEKLVAKAKQQGFAALATPETYQGKSVLRVRVGPFHSRAEATAARLKLASVEPVSMTVDATTLNQTGDAPASAVAAGQAGAWAVQLGAYATEAVANQLRDKLRGQGFAGYVDTVTTAKGKLWRVRAGPFASRSVAASKRDEIAQKLQVKGAIVSQD